MPWRKKWHPTPGFLPGESHGQKSLVGYSPGGLKESDMTEHAHTHGPKLTHLELPEIDRSAVHSVHCLEGRVSLSLFFKLEDNCFTILCWFLPYINMNQP